VAQRTHEQLWAEDEGLGAFLYGSIVPDVSGEPNALTHRDTHLVGSYREDGRAVFSQSSATFLAQYETFTTRPPSAWSSTERAFLEGYLCHLSADEAWRRLLIPFWQTHRERYAREHYYAAITVLDQRSIARLRSRSRVLEALRNGAGMDILKFIDPLQGEDFKQRVCDYLAAGGASRLF